MGEPLLASSRARGLVDLGGQPRASPLTGGREYRQLCRTASRGVMRRGVMQRGAYPIMAKKVLPLPPLHRPRRRGGQEGPRPDGGLVWLPADRVAAIGRAGLRRACCLLFSLLLPCTLGRHPPLRHPRGACRRARRDARHARTRLALLTIPRKDSPSLATSRWTLITAYSRAQSQSCDARGVRKSFCKVSASKQLLLFAPRTQTVRVVWVAKIGQESPYAALRPALRLGTLLGTLFGILPQRRSLAPTNCALAGLCAQCCSPPRQSRGIINAAVKASQCRAASTLRYARRACAWPLLCI